MPDVINNPALAMYVAAAVALVVMLGFLIYLWRLDARVRELRRILDSQSAGAAHAVERQNEHEPQRLQRIERELQDGLNHP